MNQLDPSQILQLAQLGQGQPTIGQPPFTWEESALFTLRAQGLGANSVTDVPSALDAAERYNGLGYRHKGLPSPYLWSGTNQYEKGKFVSDGVYDPEAVSDQPGVAALMLGLANAGVKLF